MAAYAAGLPLVHEPGTVWNYSSGTTNIIARIVGDAVGGGQEGHGGVPARPAVRAGGHALARSRSSTRPARSSARRTCTPRPATSPGSASSTATTVSPPTAPGCCPPDGATTPARQPRTTTRAGSTTAPSGGCGPIPRQPRLPRLRRPVHGRGARPRAGGGASRQVPRRRAGRSCSRQLSRHLPRRQRWRLTPWPGQPETSRDVRSNRLAIGGGDRTRGTPHR